MSLHALVRRPTASLENGLRTHIERTPIDFARAQEQHLQYTWALREAGADISILPAADRYPDAVFVEDTALVLDSLAVMGHSSVESRRGVWGCLHLKTAVTHLGQKTVLLNPEWVPREAFSKLEQITVDPFEPMAANALLVGKRLLMSSAYRSTLGLVAKRGFAPQAVDIGEFHKAEGGLTCLSLLVETPNA